MASGGDSSPPGGARDRGEVRLGDTGVLETVTSVLDCPICLERFSDPRVLSCGHSFCLGCVEPLGRSGSLPCPTCRAETPLPTAVRDLPRPYVLLGVLQALEAVKLDSTTAPPTEPTAPPLVDVVPEPEVPALPRTQPEPSAPPLAELTTLPADVTYQPSPIGLKPLNLDWTIISAQICNFCSLDRTSGILWYNDDRDRTGLFVGPNKITSTATFCIEIIGLHGNITIGLCHKDYKHNTALGLYGDSIGYNLRNGQLYNNAVFPERIGPTEDPRSWCDPGDKVRVIVNVSDGQVSVQFNRNSEKIYQVDLGKLGPNAPWYPAVALGKPGDKVRFRDTDIWASRVFKGSASTEFARIDDCPVGAKFTPDTGFVEVDDIAVQKQKNKEITEILSQLRPIKGLEWRSINTAKSSFCILDSSTGILQYCDDRDRIALFIGSNKVLDDAVFSFEIVNMTGCITLGLTHGIPQNCIPGKQKGSIAYHALDGQLYSFSDNPTIKGPDETLPSWCSSGDKIRCLVLKPNKQFVFKFFKQGKEVYRHMLSEKESQLAWFPVISLHKHGDIVRFLDTDIWTRRNFKASSSTNSSDKMTFPISNVTMDTRSSQCMINLETQVLKYTGLGRKSQFSSSIHLEAGQQVAIEVLSMGNIGGISIGLVHGGYPDFAKPGWYQGSVGFHLSEGALYFECERAERNNKDYICRKDDIIKCLYNVTGQREFVTFFRNGLDVYHRDLGPCRPGVFWYPIISLSEKGDSVRVLQPHKLWSYLLDPPQSKAVYVKKKKKYNY